MKPRTRLLLIFIVLLVLTFFVDRWRRARIELSQDKHILAASRRYNVDPALIKAVAWRESRFDPHARGRKGEIGLMQIMPATGREWAGAERVAFYSEFTLLDPAKNTECGAWYLRKLLGRYQKTDDPVPYALADYNAGRANVLKWLKGLAETQSAEFIAQIVFPSTQNYVREVIKRKARYEAQFRE